MPSLIVRRAGLLTTVQDLGRPGQGRFGISPSGAMDPLALKVANRLVGNSDGAATLEITAVGGEIELRQRTRFALAGANLSPRLSDRPLQNWRSYVADGGEVLAFGPRRQGARCYLAVAGGVSAPLVFGSAATDIEAGLGGIDGRPLRAGQVLEIGESGEGLVRSASIALLRAYANPFELRFIAEDGPPLDPATVADFVAGTYRVSARSNRMGYRLEGTPLAFGGNGEGLSEPVPPGAIQVPAGGEPILLMADRPTVGGYPRLGAVIAADLPKAGQLFIGHKVRFRRVSLAEARSALVELAALVEGAVSR